MISYHFEDTNFVFKGKTLNNKWLRLVSESEIRRIGDISIIFCSDNYILNVNQQYLSTTTLLTSSLLIIVRVTGFLVISSSVLIQFVKMLSSMVLISRRNLTG